MSQPDDTADVDPRRWLEEVTGGAALEWVRARNASAAAELAGAEKFGRLREELLEVLDSDARIPYVRRRGDYLYNFWRDAAHPRGLWRRVTLAEYGADDPTWQVLLDVDALAEHEGENWVWQGATVLRPGYRRCLVELSRGGADATVVREFDLGDRVFVESGFFLAEAKSIVSWIDFDHIYVGTDFGPGSLTTSGYPRVAKVWARGTPLEQASTIYEGAPDDVAVHATHDPTPGFERDLIVRDLDFYRAWHFLRTDDGLVRLDLPDDAEAMPHREWLLVRTRSAWRTGEHEHPAGALLAARLTDFLAGDRTMSTLFEPDPHSTLEAYAATREHVLLAVLTDVRTRLHIRTPGNNGWHDQLLPAPGAPGALASAELVAADPDGDEYFLDTGSFTEPSTLARGELPGTAESIKHAPAFFPTRGLRTRQHFATSHDGTRIPYFVVGADGGSPGPTLLTGYGGFEISMTPHYSGVIGRGWLARGGTYVVANLRGGGEYGPTWHEQATKAGRHLVYEDCAAVAADLVRTGVTTPAQLGVHGGSNGGLLTGVMLTRYPELFGAVVSQVPLLDMRRYHRLLAGASWMAEYGDPDDPQGWAILRAHSPYHLVDGATRYPPSLFVTSTRDDRVHPGHARKMVATLLEHGHDVRYYENIEGGHGAAADNAQLAYNWALIFEFLWSNLS